MNPTIIDTDPGVDDSLAISLALLSPKTNVIGLTTVFGNSNIDNTTKNAQVIVKLLNKNTPVYPGASLPLSGNTPTWAKSQGQNGLGGFTLKNFKPKLQNANAIEFFTQSLINSLTPTNLICLGPTTNLAIFSLINPKLANRFKQIIILGGVFNQNGNISPVSEFNVFNDPAALKIVLANFSNVTLIPINICRQVIFTLKDFDQIKNNLYSANFKQISKNYIDYYQNNMVYGKFSGGIMYDLLATGFLIEPKLFKYTKVNVQVETNFSSSAGQTFIDPRLPSNCNLITSVDSVGLKQLFIKTLNQ